jgi:hypothetical protein
MVVDSAEVGSGAEMALESVKLLVLSIFRIDPVTVPRSMQPVVSTKRG